MSGSGHLEDQGRARTVGVSGKPETPMNAGVLTVSDRVSRGEAEDRSGPRAAALLAGSAMVVNLPGSVAGVEESLAVVGPALRHACELAAGGSSEHGVESC